MSENQSAVKPEPSKPGLQRQSRNSGALLYRYNRARLILRLMGWGIAALVILYGVLSLRASRALSSALDSGTLGREMAVCGPTILLTHTIDGNREILVSTDSGGTFTRTADRHLKPDSTVYLAIAPDSSTLLALERNGRIHYRLAGENSFRGFTYASSIRFFGMAFVPGTDSMYLYGDFGSVIRGHWAIPNLFEIKGLGKIQSLQSLAFNRAHKVVAIGRRPNSNVNLLFSASSPDSLQSRAYLDPATGGPLLNLLLQSDFVYHSVGYIPSKDLFYTTDFFSGAPLEIRYLGDTTGQNLSSVNLKGLRPRFRNTSLTIDSLGRPIYYGNGPYIQKDSTLESIPNGSDVLALGLIHNQPLWALAENGSRRYLYQKTGNAWILNPVLIRPESSPLALDYLPFLIALLLALAGLFWNYTNRLSTRITNQIPNIVNELLTKSEKPLGLEDPDLLGFTAIEEAITKIIRNPQLDLPMTIVISGSWGSGKSSMMNRIRERLQETPALRRRFMTTWFNAWHLQGETSLLNAFLLNIIGAYEQFYSTFSPFRIRIFGRRFLRLPFWKIFGIGFASILILPFVILIVLKIFNVHHLRSWGWVDNWCNILTRIFLTGKDLNLEILNPVGAGALILFSLFFLNRQFVPAGLSAFFELLPKNNFKLDVEKTEIGSREKFRQQYWEIMQAAQADTRLVVFIDDLDRVGGDKILELLEGINFISDIASRPPDALPAQPNTIFILGMYTQEVARLVGAKLQEINKADLPEEVLGNFYIEKMVQLVVPVPFDAGDPSLVIKLYAN